MKSYLYKTEEGAKNAAKELGCRGFHKHKRKTFMPCGTHKQFLKKTKSQKRKSEISQKVAKQVGEIINFARFLCTQESFGHIKKFHPPPSCPLSHSPSYPL